MHPTFCDLALGQRMNVGYQAMLPFKYFNQIYETALLPFGFSTTHTGPCVGETFDSSTTQTGPSVLFGSTLAAASAVCLLTGSTAAKLLNGIAATAPIKMRYRNMIVS
jgi:hypothetical protein